MSEMVHITINKQPLEVPAGTRIIEAAKMPTAGCAWWRWWAPAS